MEFKTQIKSSDDCTQNQHFLFKKIRAGNSDIARAKKAKFAVIEIEPCDMSLNKKKTCVIVFRFRHG